MNLFKKKKDSGKVSKEYTIISEVEGKRILIDNWYVWTSNDVYKKIFKNPLKKHGRMPWKRRVIRIFSEKTKSSVYRIWRGVPAYMLSKDQLFLDREAKNILKCSGDGKEADDKVLLVLSPSTKHSFYWQHFSPEIRTAYKLGLISLLLGAISLFISIISWII